MPDSRSLEIASSMDLPAYEDTIATSKSALDKVIKEVMVFKEPEDLLVHLLSTKFSLHDKLDMLDKAPLSLWTRPMERFGKMGGQITDAGFKEVAMCIYRLVDHTNSPKEYKLSSSLAELIKINIEGRWTVQRLIWMQPKVRAVEICLEKAKSEVFDTRKVKKLDSRLKAYSKYQNDLRERLWALVKKECSESDSIDSWPVWYAYKLRMRFPDWYLSRFWCNDCARRGGCCGRSCGCCEKPRKTYGAHDSLFARGHCTSACACCMKAYGIDRDVVKIEIPDLQELEPELKLGLAGQMGFYMWDFFREFVFGLKDL